MDDLNQGDENPRAEMSAYSQAYYINLDIRTDRRARLERDLKPCPWSARRVPGVVLEKAPEELGIAMHSQRTGMRGVAGIWRAHRNCLELALNEPDGRFVIFEDDVSIDPQFWKDGLLDLASPPDDWEIVLISPRFKDKAGPVDYHFDGFEQLASAPHGCSGAHFVMLRNQAVIQRILQKMDQGPVTDVDVFYIEKFKTYGLMSPHVRAGGFASDHQGLHGNDLATQKRIDAAASDDEAPHIPPTAPMRLEGAIIQFTQNNEEILFYVTDERDTIQREHSQGRFYEREELAIIGRHFPKDGVFLDIGAHIGNHSVYIGKYHQPRKIIPVEPLPAATNLLRVNLRLNALSALCDLRMIGLGFGEKAHFASATFIPGNLGGTRLSPTADQNGLRITTGDAALGSERIDLIKIDTETMELQTLAGLKQVIARNRPIIFIAVHHENRKAFNDWMAAHAYEAAETYSRYGSSENLLIMPINAR